jgi:ribosomal protein L7/L12
MKDDFREYELMKAAGIDAKMVFVYARKIGLEPFAQIRMLRSVFGLSLVEAKEVTVTADGASVSLSEHQEKLFPALKEALRDNRP